MWQPRWTELESISHSAEDLDLVLPETMMDTLLLELHCVYPIGAIRVGQRGSSKGCDVSDSVVVLLWCLPSSLSPDSALGVFFRSCRVGWSHGLGARVWKEKGRNCLLPDWKLVELFP